MKSVSRPESVATVDGELVGIVEGVIAEVVSFEVFGAVSERIAKRADRLGGQDCVRQEEMSIFARVTRYCWSNNLLIARLR